MKKGKPPYAAARESRLSRSSSGTHAIEVMSDQAPMQKLQVVSAETRFPKESEGRTTQREIVYLLSEDGLRCHAPGPLHLVWCVSHRRRPHRSMSLPPYILRQLEAASGQF